MESIYIGPPSFGMKKSIISACFSSGTSPKMTSAYPWQTQKSPDAKDFPKPSASNFTRFGRHFKFISFFAFSRSESFNEFTDFPLKASASPITSRISSIIDMWSFKSVLLKIFHDFS